MKGSFSLALLIAVITASPSHCSSAFASQRVSQCRPTSTVPRVARQGQVHFSRMSMSETLPEANVPIHDRNSTKDSIDEELNLPAEDTAGEAGGHMNRRALVAISGVASLSAVILAAKFGVLRGPPLDDGSFARYTDASILRDAGASLLSFGLAYGFVKGNGSLAKNGILDPKDSRKIIHTLSGPLFIMVWPIFSTATGARFFAGIVPILNALRLFLAATGGEEETELANAVSRSGDAKEALGGPFLYVITIAAAILLFWRESLPGIIAVSTMAAGDGMADIVGRRLGKNNKWSFSESKSIAGSVAFALASTLTSISLAAWMTYTGCLTLPLPMSELAPRIAAISLACAGVELVPIGDDNWTVPLSAAILSILFLS